MRHCTECRADLPDSEFYKGVHNRLCKTHYKAYMKPHRIRYHKDPKNAESLRSNRLRWCYGIVGVEYNTLLDAQGHCCAICGIGDMEDGSKKRLFVDHCHTTGKVRGLLCNRCNRGLGYFKDSPEVLRRAATYLG